MRIEILNGSQAGQSVALSPSQGPVNLGATTRFGRLEGRGTGFELVDLGGGRTFVNGKPVPANTAHPLAGGDEFSLGDVRYRFIDETTAPIARTAMVGPPVADGPRPTIAIGPPVAEEEEEYEEDEEDDQSRFDRTMLIAPPTFDDPPAEFTVPEEQKTRRIVRAHLADDTPAAPPAPKWEPTVEMKVLTEAELGELNANEQTPAQAPKTWEPTIEMKVLTEDELGEINAPEASPPVPAAPATGGPTQAELAAVLLRIQENVAAAQASCASQLAQTRDERDAARAEVTETLELLDELNDDLVAISDERDALAKEVARLRQGT